MGVASILVLLNGEDGDRVTADAALKIGRAFDAAVDGLIVRPDPRDTLRLAVDGMSPAMIESIMAAGRADADARTAKARQAYTEACDAAGTPIESSAKATWTEEIGDTADIIAARGRLADIIVVGRAGEDGGADAFLSAETALFQTGRPVMLVGPDPLETLEGQAMVAWNGSAEAARAVAGALPLLSRADGVLVVAIDEDDSDLPSSSGLASYLERHGLRISRRAVSSAGRAIADCLADEAEQAGATLLVMGAYGHSRLRELVLGGVTRGVLTKGSRPVLMAH